jgi:hypothetical protein
LVGPAREPGTFSPLTDLVDGDTAGTGRTPSFVDPSTHRGDDLPDLIVGRWVLIRTHHIAAPGTKHASCLLEQQRRVCDGMNNPNRYGMSDARGRDRAPQCVAVHHHGPKPLVGTDEHRSGQIQTEDRSSPSPQTKGNHPGAHTDLQDRIVTGRKVNIDVCRVVVAPRLTAAHVVVVLGELIELSHGSPPKDATATELRAD